jgi:hypothetical protein
MDEDDVTALTDNQKHKNYLEITESIGHLKNGSRITEDWIEENKRMILKWRDWVENYAIVNPEVNDLEFRKKCSNIEVLLQHLCSTIKYTGTFDVKVYAILLDNMKGICEYLFTDQEIEDLMEHMSL